MPYQEIEITHDAIKSFWFTERIFSATDADFEVLPDGFIELIFFFGASCSLRQKEGNCTNLSSPFIVGLLDKPLFLNIEGHIHVFGVRLYPWAAFSFLNITPKINGNVFLGDDSFDHITALLKKQTAQSSAKEALEFIHTYFIQKIIPVNMPCSFIKNAGNTIIKDEGSLSIKKLASNYHVSLRTLQRNFLKTSGNSAKAIARKVRFEKVRNFIWFHPDCNLTQLAYEYHFADQAHLNHEFKFFSGKSPGAFAKEARRAAEFFKTNNVAFIQAAKELR